uniref:Bee-milk protein n=1 Tax=Pristhesancus plagipennis TaxID=1955184 RepID=A0A2K8JVE3_PRIPG|nr:secreted hypothetical protein [Pristhesancus plagipennis]
MYSYGALLLAAILAIVSSELEVMFQWNLINWDMPFNYPLSTPYTGRTTIANSVEIGWDRIFLTLPRIWSGNPASLAVVPRSKDGYPTDQSPPLQAYPSWDWHTEAASGSLGSGKGNCSGFVSVFRVKIDRCNRLWVMDSGILDSLVTFSVVCPPRIFIFDLATDRLLRTITLPKSVTRPNTLIANFELDEPSTALSSTSYNSCDNIFVYMTDTTNPGIIVYDVARENFWRLQHPNMYADPDFGTYRVAGESYTLMDGILGLALSAPSHNMERTLYFQPFASNRLFSIPTSVLQSGPNPGDDGELPVTLVGHKSSQAAGLCIDQRDGSLLFSPVTETALASWQPGSSYHKVLAYSPAMLQVVTDLKSATRDGGTIWIVSTRLQKFFRQTINPKEMHVRILRLVPDPPPLNSSYFYYH